VSGGGEYYTINIYKTMMIIFELKRIFDINLKNFLKPNIQISVSRTTFKNQVDDLKPTKKGS